MSLSRVIGFLTLIISFYVNAQNVGYPATWWKPVPRDQARPWEILPQDAKVGVEVILSKRNELGVFSNLAHTPFTFENETYESVEAFWQMMKYPDPSDVLDPRNQFANQYPYTRDQVKNLFDFESKNAGEVANKIMKDHGINWISYKGKKFEYKDMSIGSEFHYKLISRVIKEKIMQNLKIKTLLLRTGDLILRPDHVITENSPKSYYYFDILMLIRSDLKMKKYYFRR